MIVNIIGIVFILAFIVGVIMLYFRKPAFKPESKNCFEYPEDIRNF